MLLLTLCVDESVYVTKSVSKLLAYVCMLYYDFKLIILNYSYLENVFIINHIWKT